MIVRRTLWINRRPRLTYHFNRCRGPLDCIQLFTAMPKDIPQVEWKQNGEFWFVFIDGIVRRCVSCGKPIEHRGDSISRADHHCSISHEAAKKSANTRHREPLERDVPWGKMLADGCEMLGLD